MRNASAAVHIAVARSVSLSIILSRLGYARLWGREIKVDVAEYKKRIYPK